MASNVTQRIYELQVKLASESLAQLKKLQTEAEKTSKAVNSLNDMAKNIGAGLLAGFTLDAFISGVSSAITYVDDLTTSAQQLGGISVESFSALTFAAEQSDVSIGGLQNGIKELQRSINEMGTSAKGGAILDALGIDKAQDIESILGDVADAFVKIQDPVQQTNVLLEVFGRAGLELRPLLQQGSAGIEELTDKARELGLVIDGDTSKSLGDLDNAMLQLQAVTRDLFVDIADGLAPSLLRISELFLDNAEGSDAFKVAGEALGKTLEGLTIAGAAVVSVFKIAGQRIGALAAAFVQLTQGNFSQALDIMKMNVEDTKNEFKGLYDTVLQVSGAQKENAAATGEAAKQAGLNAEQQEKLNKALIGGNEASKEKTSSTKKATEADKEAAEALRVRQQLEAEGESLRVSMRTDLEVLNESIDRYKFLLEQTAISQETYNRAVAAANDNYEKAIAAADETNENLTTTDELLKQIADNVDGYGKDISGALVSFALGTEDAADSFSDFVTSVLEDLATMATQILIIQPLIDSLRASLSGTTSSGIGSFFSSIFANAKGNAFNNGQVMAFARGGVVNTPTLFPMAKGLGLMGEAGPEAVMPLARDSSGKLGVSADSAGLTVNIYNQTDSQVSAEQSQDVNGERVLNVMVVRAVETAINSGRLDSTFNNTYGLTRRGR